MTLLDALYAERPEEEVSRIRLAASLLLLGDAEAAAGEALAAEAAWQRAADTLTPLAAAAGSRDHQVLVPWAAVLERLGRGEEAVGVRSTLAALGVTAASRPVGS